MFGRATKDDRWEDAYRGLLIELETKERQWSAVETDLRRAAAQLAIAAMGQSTTLDEALTDVVKVVRDGSEDIDAPLDRLSAALKRAEKRASRSQIERLLYPSDADPSEDPPKLAESPPTGNSAASSITELDIRIVINALTNRLAQIPELSQIAEQIARQPQTKDQGWSDVLNGVADSVAQVVSSIQTQRNDLEGFLESVTTQLAQFEQWTQWHLADTQLRRDDNTSLEQAVSEQMEGLHEDVQSSETISDIKTSVQQRLQSVADRFKQFRETEANRLDEAEKRNSKLLGEIARLQHKTTELSRLCGDQEQQIMFDSLTGVHSRYAYEQRLLEEYQRWQRTGTALAYSLWDIDKFKSINDTYGHDAGDRLLRRLGRIFNKHKRAEDFIARIGGEEFALLLPATDADSALVIANRLREAIADTPFHYRGSPETVTISCGITEFRDGDTPLSAYQRADKALYEAKNSGRNLCIPA